jgi:hypothetical protein
VRAAIVAVCRSMSWRVEYRRGPPAAESAGGVVRLWRVEHFREVSLLPDEPWPLSGDVVLRGDDPVLDFHIVGDKLLGLLSGGRRWREIIRQEFHSLAPQLERRDEVALVGSTILARQVAEFGAALRPIPPGLHRSWDTFYRKLFCWRFIRAAPIVPRATARPCSRRQLLGWNFAADSDDRRRTTEDGCRTRISVVCPLSSVYLLQSRSIAPRTLSQTSPMVGRCATERTCVAMTFELTPVR